MTIRFDPRMTLGRAWAVVDDLLSAVAVVCPGIEQIIPAGDIRRMEPIVRGITLVGLAREPDAALGSLEKISTVHTPIQRTKRQTIVGYGDLEIRFRIAAPDEYGSVLFDATGTLAHVRAVTRRRSGAGPCAGEEDVYRQAGLPFIPPELRAGSDEIDAALAGELPTLVERQHIRGDLHMHTDFSDGRDTVADMVQSSRSLGYEYIAITDHSEGAGASRTLRADEIAKQRDEIARLRELHRDIEILHGVEVDILPGGGLDFEDRVLEGFDIVLASLHDSGGHDAVRLTRRCLDAIRHPLVNVLTHPSNQLVGRRAGYPLDYDAVYAAAVDTGTALEVDGAPSHLDLDGEHARAAVAAGATLVIDSDCHRASSLERQMALGIGTARRGWVPPERVLNTRPIADVRAFVAQKRARSR